MTRVPSLRIFVLIRLLGLAMRAQCLNKLTLPVPASFSPHITQNVAGIARSQLFDSR